MLDALATAVIAASLVLAAVAAVPLLRPVRLGRVLLAGLGVLQLAVLAQLVAGVVLAVTTPRPAEIAVFFGYQIATVLILPAGLSWSLADRSRWSPLVLTVACLVVAILTVRMQQIWAIPVA